MDKETLSVRRLREIDAQLGEMTKKPPRGLVDTSLAVLDHSEFMQLFRISRRTSQIWRNSGKIRHLKIGGRVYFTVADIEKLIRESGFEIRDSEIRI